MWHRMVLLYLLAAGLAVPASADGPEAEDLRARTEQTWLTQLAQRRAPASATGRATTRSDAAGAVDGRITGGFGFHTNQEASPWWRVDLGTSEALDRVVVWNRCTAAASRAARLEVLLSADGRAWKTVYRHDGSTFYGKTGGKPLTVPLNGAKARVVRLRAGERTWLHLDEVQVFSAADPKVNVARGRPADQSSVSQWSQAKALPQADAEPAYPVDAALERARGLLAERRADGVDVSRAARAVEDAKAQAADLAQDAPAESRRKVWLRTRWGVRRLVLADARLATDRLLFVRRKTYSSSHIYTDHFDGSDRFGGNLCILSPVAPEGNATEIVPDLAGGIFGRFDLSCDGRRIVFAYKRKPEEGYRLWEVGVDGSGLRQLTHDAPDEAALRRRYRHGTDDLDPCYLPDGRIAFASTRTRRAVLCHNAFTSTALHVVNADGTGLRPLSGNPVNEFTPTVCPDGRILYTRWEYVDKGCGDVQSLWSMHPDGTQSNHVYKNNVRRPATLIDARAIPGSPRLVAVGAPHMPLAVGPLVLIDPNVDQHAPGAMVNLTPEIQYPGHAGYPSKACGFYKEPWPLGEDLFLVAYNPGPDHADPAGYALYVLDGEGNREFLYGEADFSCFQPMPLRPRPRPRPIPTVAEADPAGRPHAAPAGADDLAALVMVDVYDGLTGIERGRVKYLRVMEDVPKPWSDSYDARGCGDSLGLQNPAVSLNGHFAIKKIWGVVPVEADGSVRVRVPAEKNLYFQVLDEHLMELQRMRTFVNLMPGETRSCIGCHEPRNHAPVPRRVAALRGPVRRLGPQPGDHGPRTVHYPADVQPILDRHCTRCHGGEKPKAGVDLSGGLTKLFNTSYETLIRKGLVNKVDVNPRDAYIPAEPPLTFGSHKSRLVAHLEKGHQKVRLAREEFVRLVTWIDANAPYYGTYGGKRNLKWKDDPAFRPAPDLARAAAGGPRDETP